LSQINQQNVFLGHFAVLVLFRELNNTSTTYHQRGQPT